MKLSANRLALDAAIKQVLGVVPGKATLPILNHLLVTADMKTGLTIRSTDLDIHEETTVECETEVAGSSTVDAKIFSKIINLMESTFVDLEVEKHKMKIIGGGSHFKLNALPAEEFPQSPSHAGGSMVVLEARVLKRMIALTRYAISDDDSRYALTGLLFEFDGEEGVKLTATDGRRAAWCSHTVNYSEGEKFKVIIPKDSVDEAYRVLVDNGLATIKLHEGNIKFDFKPNSEDGDIGSIHSRSIDAQFPDMNKVTPTEFKAEISVPRKEALACLSRVCVLSPTWVRFEIADGELKLTGKDDTDTVKDGMKVNYSGDPIRVSFNTKYLREVFASSSFDELLFRFSDERAATMIESKAESMTYLIMPVMDKEEMEEKAAEKAKEKAKEKAAA